MEITNILQIFLGFIGLFLLFLFKSSISQLKHYKKLTYKQILSGIILVIIIALYVTWIVVRIQSP